MVDKNKVNLPSQLDDHENTLGANRNEKTIAKEHFLKYLLLTPYAQPLLQLLQKALDEYE